VDSIGVPLGANMSMPSCLRPPLRLAPQLSRNAIRRTVPIGEGRLWGGSSHARRNAAIDQSSTPEHAAMLLRPMKRKSTQTSFLIGNKYSGRYLGFKSTDTTRGNGRPIQIWYAIANNIDPAFASPKLVNWQRNFIMTHCDKTQLWFYRRLTDRLRVDKQFVFAYTNNQLITVTCVTCKVGSSALWRQESLTILF
jgi:hypothetical protein